MARTAMAVWAMLAIGTATAAAQAAGALTAGDRGWLQGNLNLAGDSPALLELSPTQQARLHALIADRKAGPDRQRQNIVQFLTEATDRSLDHALDNTATRPAGAPTELGANRPR
ncbi:MAG TPA: hypothetical protein VIJ42_07405 [Stellaceae bacterium]